MRDPIRLVSLAAGTPAALGEAGEQFLFTLSYAAPNAYAYPALGGGYYIPAGGAVYAVTTEGAIYAAPPPKGYGAVAAAINAAANPAYAATLAYTLVVAESA